MSNEKETPGTTVSFGQLFMSVLAAFFGVQSNANRERDFKNGKLSHFIFLGLLAAATFILILFSVVMLVMKIAGA